jgi:hypothetical protein
MPKKFRNHEFVSPCTQSEKTSLKFTLKKLKNLFYFPEILTVLGIKIMQFWTNQLRLWRSVSHADEGPQIAAVSNKVLQNMFRLVNVKSIRTVKT